MKEVEINVFLVSTLRDLYDAVAARVDQLLDETEGVPVEVLEEETISAACRQLSWGQINSIVNSEPTILELRDDMRGEPSTVTQAAQYYIGVALLRAFEDKWYR